MGGDHEGWAWLWSRASLPGNHVAQYIDPYLVGVAAKLLSYYVANLVLVTRDSACL
jgi:hypothetical protein